MEKRSEQQSQQKLLSVIGISQEVIEHIKGADEIDIVYTALDEIMSQAVRSNWDYAVRNKLNFRDACLVNAI